MADVSLLKSTILEPLKHQFVGRSEVVDLTALALVAGEHLFLYGPPGTAKSALIRAFAGKLQSQYFEYLLTRFTEPNELFGPIDLVKLRDGRVATVTTGMLPEAEFVFLDELFNANSAILNNLLTVLNERVYRRGAETHRLPLLSLFSASNHLPEDETLQALFDRFLLRCRVDSLSRDQLPSLLEAGWNLEKGSNPADFSATISIDDLREMSNQALKVQLQPILTRFAEVVIRVRDLGVMISDRRAVKILKLVAASAVICGRDEAILADFWVFRYVWDRAEQIGPLGALVEEILKTADKANAHPLALATHEINGEELAQKLDSIESELDANSNELATLAKHREHLARLQDQASWLTDETVRQHLLDRAESLLRRIGN
jgi:MoxR-like ATPase